MNEEKNGFFRGTRGRIAMGVGIAALVVAFAVSTGIHFQGGGSATVGTMAPAHLYLGREVLMTVTEKKITELSKVFGATAQQRLTEWRTLMTSAENQALPERRKLELVNDFMNQTPFVSDQEHWGKASYWALPVEFLSTNGGDGEDFAVAKYFTLLALGVSDEKLKIVSARETRVRKEAHMVLAYFATPDAEPLILDNFDKTLHPASARTDLVLLEAFNETVLRVGEQKGAGKTEDNDRRAERWNELKRRMKAAA
jgi:predicted transglutaminase-like cysteine proteinase